MAGFYRGWFICEGQPGNCLTIDLAIRDDGRISDRLPMNGWWGRISSDDIWPFILKTNGAMDFGNTASHPLSDFHRYADFDIHKKVIAGGQFFSLKYGINDYKFHLRSLKRFEDFERWDELDVSKSP